MDVTTPTGPQVYSLRKGAIPPPSDAVRVDRRTPYGNPYRLQDFPTPADCIAAFRAYALERLAREPDWLEPLRAKTLICWCRSPGDPPDVLCHATVLVELANEERRG